MTDTTTDSPPLRPIDIAARIATIRLPRKELAKLAGVDEDNVGRVLRGSDARTSTLDKLSRAVVEEERRLCNHLVALHPDLAGAAS